MHGSLPSCLGPRNVASRKIEQTVSAVDADSAGPSVQLDTLETIDESVYAPRRENYKIFAFLESSPLVSTTVHAILDRETGLNLVHTDVLYWSALNALFRSKLSTERYAF